MYWYPVPGVLVYSIWCNGEQYLVYCVQYLFYWVKYMVYLYSLSDVLVYSIWCIVYSIWCGLVYSLSGPHVTLGDI